VHQDRAADDRIEPNTDVSRMQIGVHKRDVREASLKRPRTSDSEDAGVCINADHVSGGTDELGRDRRHGSDTSADIQHLHAWLEPARRALGDDQFARAWEDGRAMTREQALEFALDDSKAHPMRAPDLGIHA
jgi:hypothetical protein